MSLSDTINAISALGSLVTILVAAVTAIYFLRTRTPDMKEIVRTCSIAIVICAVIITGGIYGLHAAFPPVVPPPTPIVQLDPTPQPPPPTVDPGVTNPLINKDSKAQNMTKLVLNDPLNGSNGTDYQWENNLSNFCGFETDSAYHAYSNTAAFAACIAHQTDFMNFTYEVQTDIICCNQISSFGGISFYGQDARDMYTLFIYADGFVKFEVDQAGNAQSLMSFFLNTNTFNTGLNETNDIAIVTSGSSIDLFVNGYYSKTLTGNGDYTSGLIGVIGGGDSNVIYNDAKIWTA